MEADYFRGSITRLQHPPPTLPDSAFPTRARLASGCLASSTGRDLSYPLGSYRQFQLSVISLLLQQPPFALSLSWRDVILIPSGAIDYDYDYEVFSPLWRSYAPAAGSIQSSD